MKLMQFLNLWMNSSLGALEGGLDQPNVNRELFVSTLALRRSCGLLAHNIQDFCRKASTLRVQWSFQHDSKLFTIMHKSCNQHQMIWYYTCMHWFPVCQICLFSMIISWTRLSVSWAFASIIRCIASPSRFATSIKQTVNLWEGLHPWR